MSASTHEPPVHGREGRTDRARLGGGQAGELPKMLLAGCLLTALAVGCTSDGAIATGPGSPPSTTTPSPSPAAVDEQQAILGQYRKFWASLTAVSRMAPAQRREALTPFTTDPELKSLLAGMVATDARGQDFYGADVPRARAASLSPDGTRAVVNDCQDSSHSGNADSHTGQKLTVGVARNHVVVTLIQKAGIWKVYFVSHTKTPC